ncbi:hypothetical protein ACHAXA_009846 [Cyclostephanos tholiformis]|uniref:PPM-type phosphatase domain-containing protein n=1 Tax=Cyclostephanos tholiformis TaxID=382380 RepID=A0ABD3R5X7_9STRA
MYVTNILAVRGSSALSNGCRGVSPRSSTSTTQRSRTPNSGTVAVTSAGAVCTLCNSLRTTAACSASTVPSLRYIHSPSLDNPVRTTVVASAYRGHSHFGSGMGTAVVAWNQINIDHGAACNPTLKREISFHSMSDVKNMPLQIYNLRDITATVGASAMALSSQGALLDGGYQAPNSSSGGSTGLAGAALLFAGAASVGSILLGPMDGLRGKSTTGGGGGGRGLGGSSGGPVGDKYQHSFDSTVKERDDKEDKLGLDVSSVPRPYEVSVRALRGGRLAMEDEFIVVGGGRFSAIFDGHGGGGVSQYLRDRLHVIISEKLHQQEKSLRAKGKIRGELKRFWKRGDDITDDGALSASPSKYDMSSVGQLPISAVAAALKEAFDQVDNETMQVDEFEYQGSTAVATILHEANDGTRSLLAANIGDSRGVLSRSGTAVELTRDHKPNDDREKARILALGEKIEWDHYCKVHRVRNLSLSRAIGDRFAKPAVSGEVEIKCFPVENDKDEFIVLASDGLWDVMSSQEVVSYVHKRLKASPKDGAAVTCDEDMDCLRYLRRKNMSRFIANEALRRGSGDNISVVIVWLKNFDAI